MDRSDYDNFLTCVIFTTQYRIAMQWDCRETGGKAGLFRFRHPGEGRDLVGAA
jgi:hypothetical protein